MSNSASGQLKKQLTYIDRPSGPSVNIYSKPGSKSPFTASQSQLTRRASYADGVALWNGFSEEKKAEYVEAAAPLRLSGFNYFIQLYLSNQCLLNGLVFYWKKITINHAYISDTLIDYPLYLDLALFGSDFFGRVKSGGADIRIVENNLESERPREVVLCDTSEQTGEVHTLLASISALQDTSLFLLYGNGEAIDYAVDAPFGAQAVWSGYWAVWHLQNNVNDSSENLRHGSVVSATEIDAQIGRGYSFNGTDNRLNLPNLNTMPNDFSISLLVKRIGNDETNSRIFNGGFVGDPVSSGFAIFKDSSTASDKKLKMIFIDTNDTQEETEPAILTDDYNHYCGTKNGLSIKSFLNGISTGPGASLSIETFQRSYTNMQLGGRGTSNNFGGILDEVRIYAGVYQDGLQFAEYNNQINTALFYSVE